MLVLLCQDPIQMASAMGFPSITAFRKFRQPVQNGCNDIRPVHAHGAHEIIGGKLALIVELVPDPINGTFGRIRIRAIPRMAIERQQPAQDLSGVKDY